MGGPGPAGADKETKKDDLADIAGVQPQVAEPKTNGDHNYQDGHKPKNGNDSSPKHANHKDDHHKKKGKKDDKAVGVDASKPGQALEKILAANDAMKGLQHSASKLESDAQSKKVEDEKIVTGAQSLASGIKTTKAILDGAWVLLHDHVLNLITEEHHGEKEAKETTLNHPGLHKAVHDLTYGLAHLISSTSAIGDARPAVKADLADANRMITDLNIIQGNLGIPQTHYQALLDLVEIKVSISVVDLGTGRPRDQIQEHVIAMAIKWNEMMSNMATGIENFVRTVDMTSVKEAPNGLMEKVWDKALELVKKGAELVAGTPLAAEIGIEAIKKIVAYGDKLEAARVQQDEDAFIKGLWDKLDELQLKGAAEGGNPKLHKVVQALDKQFQAIGAAEKPDDTGKTDEWTDKDHVVIGEQADFLKGLEKKSNDYASSTPTIKDFESNCFIEFINASHKLRNRSAWRSPFEGSTYMDGYVQVDLTLYKMGNYFLGKPDSGKLHCPKASGIAKELTNTMGDKLSMWDLNTPLVIKVSLDDGARDDMPETYAHDRSTEISMDSNKMVQGAQWLREYWDWIMTNCGTSTYDVLTSVRKLDG